MWEGELIVYAMFRALSPSEAAITDCMFGTESAL
jgi:hypothetical protein